MNKYEYVVLEGWEQLSKFANLYKETAKIKQIKSDKKIGPKSKNLNIMGLHGWELITAPIIGPDLLIFKKKI